MSLAEDALYVCLTDVEELEVIANARLDPKCIPKEEMRPVVEWAIQYYLESGMRRAPSREALLSEWERHIENARVTLLDEDEEHESAAWAIAHLKGQYQKWKFGEIWKTSAAEVLNAAPSETSPVLDSVVDELTQLILDTRDHTNEKEGHFGIIDAIARYEKREAENTQHIGISFGIPEIDKYTYGIHPGEIAVLGAPSKSGKSLLLTLILLNEWRRKRKTVLITMENSVEMTYDRIICMMLAIDPERWEEGRCTDDEKLRFANLRDEKLDDLRDYIHVVMPDPKDRSPIDIVRYARSLDAEGLLIDQLTFMEPSERRLDGHKAIKHMLHELKAEISYGKQKLPCVLVHQFTREALKDLKKNPVIQPYHYAEGSEVERTADWAFGLFASEDQNAAGLISLQTIFARRRKPKSWELVFRPFQKNIQVYRELNPEEMRGELKR